MWHSNILFALPTYWRWCSIALRHQFYIFVIYTVQETHYIARFEVSVPSDMNMRSEFMYMYIYIYNLHTCFLWSLSLHIILTYSNIMIFHVDISMIFTEEMDIISVQFSPEALDMIMIKRSSVFKSGRHQSGSVTLKWYNAVFNLLLTENAAVKWMLHCYWLKGL